MGMDIGERGREGARAARPLARDGEVAVAITQRQQSRLFDELPRHREALRFTLMERALVGTPAALALVARRLDDSRSVALALGQATRARQLSQVLDRLSRAGVEPAMGFEARPVVEREPSGEASALPQLPESERWPSPPKPLHPAKRSRIHFQVEQLPKRHARGTIASRRAWRAKAKVSAQGEYPPLHGDQVFWRGGRDGVDDGRPNDERSRWMRATVTDRAEFLAKARERAAAFAVAQCKLPFPERARAAQERAWKRREFTSVQHVVRELVREDVRAGKYKWSHQKRRERERSYRRRLAALMRTWPEWLEEPVRFIDESGDAHPRERELRRVSLSRASAARKRREPHEGARSDQELVARLMAQGLSESVARERASRLRKVQRSRSRKGGRR